MISIRLKRIGKKNKPSFQIIVTEKKLSPKSKYIEKLGHYSPINPKILKINIDKINKWVTTGACVSNRVNSLIKSYKKNRIE